MKLIPIAFTLAAFWTGTSSAEEFVLRGIGTNTCGQLAAAYAKSVTNELHYYNWAQGYMSGVNNQLFIVGQRNAQRDLNAMTVDEQLSFIRIYCDKHPLQYYVNAVEELYVTLPKIRPKPKK